MNIRSLELMEEPLIGVGIDLGTTATVLSYTINGEFSQDLYRIPSAVAVDPNNNLVVGESALTMIENNPCSGIVNSKRLIGRPFKDPVVEIECEKGKLGKGPQIIMGDEIPGSKEKHHYFKYLIKNERRGRRVLQDNPSNQGPKQIYISPIEVAAEILKAVVRLIGTKSIIEQIISDIKKNENERRVSIVITIPAYFSLPQVEATDQAAE